MKKTFFALFLVLASNAMAATGDPCGNGYAYVANADGYCCRKVAASSPTSSTCVPPSQVVTVVSSYNTMFGRGQKACCLSGSSFQILTAADSGKCKENGGLEFLVNGKPYCCAKGSRI